MKTKNIICLFIAILICLILGYVLGSISADYVIEKTQNIDSVSSNIENVTLTDSEKSDYRFKTIIYFCFYLLMLVALPVFIKGLNKAFNEKIILSILLLEVVGIIFAYITTPPDYLTTIIMLVIWQPVVIVNTLILSSNSRYNRF